MAYEGNAPQPMYPTAPGTTPQPTSPYATSGAPTNPAQGQINPNQINQSSQPGLPNLAQMGQGFAAGGSVGQSQGLASLGRGQDSMLVHMTPGEVQGLQKLAMSAGGSLTINPQTGLPEAGFLSSILPMVASAVGTYFGGPMGGALAGSLAGGMTNKQSPLMGAIMGGMSGYAMGGVGDALKGVGSDAASALAQGELNTAQAAADTTAQAARQAAIEKATTEQGQALANFGADQMTGAPGAMEAVAPTFPYNPQEMGKGAYEAAFSDPNQFKGYTPTTQAALNATPQQNMQAGFSKVTGSWDAAKDFALKNKTSLLGGVALPLGMAALIGSGKKNTLGGVATQPTQYYNTSYSPGTVNPLRGQPGQPYFLGQGYGPGSYGPTVTGAQGGIVGYAMGGTASSAAADMFPAPKESEDRPFIKIPTSTLSALAKGAKNSKDQAAAIKEINNRANESDSPYMDNPYADTKGVAHGGLMSLAAGGSTTNGMGAADYYQGLMNGTPLHQAPPSPDAMNAYLANLNSSLQYTPPPTPVAPATPAVISPPAVPTTAVGTAGTYTYNPTTHTYSYVPVNPAAAGMGGVGGYTDQTPGDSSTGSSSMGNDPAGTAGASGGDDAPSGDGSPGNGDYAFGGSIHNQYAAGGMASMPEYAAGGKLLRGPGDGMSDSIPAVINGPTPQRAALADGEFVIPADVVSHLGNGSTEAGSKQLYAMMDKIRHARTGNKKQSKQIDPAKFMLA